MTPVDGTVIAWSSADSVGRISLASGEVVRFGASACTFLPAVGLAVRVLGLEPHRLGGQRATSVAVAAVEDADAVLDAHQPLPGTESSEETLTRFVELTDDVGLLGVVVREPVRSRHALREWLSRAGASVDFTNARCPLVRAGPANFRVWLCMSPIAGGQGVISFAPDTAFSMAEERELAVSGAALSPPRRIEPWPVLTPLAAFVERCAAGEVAVIVHQARGYLAPVATWAARRAASPDGLAAWVHIVAAKGGARTLTGMAALYLPDLVVLGVPAAEADPWLMQGATEMIAMGRAPVAGERLGSCEVISASDRWVQLVPLQGRP